MSYLSEWDGKNGESNKTTWLASNFTYEGTKLGKKKGCEGIICSKRV